MATYGKISCAFWSSQTIRSLSDDGKLMAAYLLTSSHTTICGAFRLPDGYVMEDMGWPIERIKETLSELSANGFAERCEETKWVVIHKFLEWNPPQNENQWKAVFRKASEVPKQAIFKNRFETVLKRFKNPVETVPTESESETDTNRLPPKIEFEVPEWVPSEAWSAWLEVRRKVKAPNTPRALKMAVNDLAKLRESGEDAEAVLRQSVVRGYRGLFPTKQGPKDGQGVYARQGVM